MLGVIIVYCLATLFGIATLVTLARKAPEGYQDDDGFHFGAAPDTENESEIDYARPATIATSWAAGDR